MQLREIFYFDKNDLNTADHKMYDPKHDQSIIGVTDTRKTRLTLNRSTALAKPANFTTTNSKKIWSL